jgi:L-lactate dehydrogenase complex protein LldG
MSDPMIEIVRRALGRSQPLQSVPPPPEIDPSITRLAPQSANLVELLVKSATQANFKLEQVAYDKIASTLVEYLQLNKCGKIGIPASALFDRLGIQQAIQSANLEVLRWDESSLDAAYDLDCGVTDVYAAVAETGSLVIRPNVSHGRALSLVPAIHIAIVEPSNIIPDLIDLFDKIGQEERAPNITIITGPSKTADIEGSLVTGVHGPGLVQIFLLT